ncbi:Uncharacterised protein [uncultured archaeon]|nr:Uncharacterised protein [uncultured archaeon]
MNNPNILEILAGLASLLIFISSTAAQILLLLIIDRPLLFITPAVLILLLTAISSFLIGLKKKGDVKTISITVGLTYGLLTFSALSIFSLMLSLVVLVLLSLGGSGSQLEGMFITAAAFTASTICITLPVTLLTSATAAASTAAAMKLLLKTHK